MLVGEDTELARLPRYAEMISRYKGRVDEYLAATYGNRRYKRIRNNLCKSLMTTLMTGKRPPEKLPDRKLTLMLTKMQRQLADDGYRLSKAWYENRVYRTGRRTIASRWQVHPLEIKHLDELWLDCRFSVYEYMSLIKKAQPPWTYDVDEIHEDVTVWLDARAIESIMLVALETYAVPKRGAKFTEAYGICFGSIRPMEEKRRGHGKHTTRYIHVSSIHTQLRARGYPDRVTFDPRSFQTQMTVARHFSPQVDIVGDFHTHPYDTVKDLKAFGGWRYSESDEASIADWVAPLRKMDYNPRVSLIIGIAEGTRRISKPGMLKPNIVRLSINKYHFYIACYRILGDRYSDRNITLNSAALPGM
jgi:hypothetical protein